MGEAALGLTQEGGRGQAEDGGQHVVHVMGHAAGQDAEALQLLGLGVLRLPLAGLFLGPFAIGDVRGGALHAGGCALLVMRGYGVEHQRDFLPVPGEVRGLVVPESAGLHPGQVLVGIPFCRGRGLELAESAAQHVRHPVAVGHLPGRVQVGEPSLDVAAPDQLLGGLHQDAVFLFALPELFQRAPLLGDVQAVPDVTQEGAPGVIAGRALVDDPAVDAAGMAQPVVHAEGLLLVEGCDIDVQAPRQIFRMDPLGPAVAQLLPQGAAREGQPGQVEIVAELVRTRGPDEGFATVGQGEVAQLGVLGLLPGLITFHPAHMERFVGDPQPAELFHQEESEARRQEARQAPDPQDRPGQVAALVGQHRGQGLGHQGPGATPEGKGVLGPEGGPAGGRQGGPPVEQQGLGTGLGPIEKLDGHVRLGLTQQSVHQVVQAERGIHPPDQMLAPVLEGQGGLLGVVDGHIDQYAGLDLGVGLLHQLHPAGHAGPALIPGPAHGLLAHGLGEHVVAEGPQVAVLEGFQVDDRAVDRLVPFRVHLVFGKALAADLRQMARLVGCGDEHGKADPLDARIGLLHPEAGDVGCEFLAAHRAPGREETARAKKGLLRKAQAHLDQVQGRVAAGFKGGTEPVLAILTILGPAPEGERQAGQQQDQGPRKARQPARGGDKRKDHGAFRPSHKNNCKSSLVDDLE